MPSFRCKIKKLRFQGILTDKETNRILDALDKAEKTAEWFTLEYIKSKIDKLPRIKVGNSNSPTVKYCIDERLLYEMLEEMKGDTE